MEVSQQQLVQIFLAMPEKSVQKVERNGNFFSLSLCEHNGDIMEQKFFFYEGELCLMYNSRNFPVNTFYILTKTGIRLFDASGKIYDEQEIKRLILEGYSPESDSDDDDYWDDENSDLTLADINNQENRG